MTKTGNNEQTGNMLTRYLHTCPLKFKVKSYTLTDDMHKSKSLRKKATKCV